MVKIKIGTFSWGAEQKDILNAEDEDRPIALNLRDNNLTVKKGEFVCIIDEVGSGKSSLLKAILNNMIQVSPEEVNRILNSRLIDDVNDPLQIVPEGKLSIALQKEKITNFGNKEKEGEIKRITKDEDRP